MPIIIAGGVYEEHCLAPPSTSLFGSGGRAAAALAELSPGLTLHGFYPKTKMLDAELAFAAFGVTTVFHDSSAVVGFEYLHPLSVPRIFPVPLPKAATPDVTGEVILRFGCLEGSFRVSGRRVIYDPQSGSAPEPFASNGSKADELAIVLNLDEAFLLTAEQSPEAAAARLRAHGTNVVVVKMGAAGALVFDEHGSFEVSAYLSNAVNKIGSGDVFSASFAHFWASCNFSPGEAADLASRYTCKYVEDRCLPLGKTPPAPTPVLKGLKNARVYLGGPFFTTPQVWLIEEARSGLLSLGIEVFSPMHDIGFGDPKVVAREDLQGLDASTAMLALLTEPDPGTLFEVGYARSRDIPVVVLLQGERAQDSTMLEGTDCDVVSDLATALYRVAWAAGQ